MERDEIGLHKETLEIEGGRKLYNYTFVVESEPSRSADEPNKQETKD